MSENSDSEGWNKLWSLNIPHKIKTFLWRFCRNTIPISNLFPILCSVCEVDVEHLLHVFFDCDFASQCWQSVGYTPDMLLVESAPVWLLEKLCVESETNMIKIATVLWRLWFARNNLVWEKKKLSPTAIVELSSKQIYEWQEDMKEKKERIVVRSQNKTVSNKATRWEASEAGRLKLNIDASLFTGTNYFAISMVVKDEQGTFLAGKTLRIRV